MSPNLTISLANRWVKFSFVCSSFSLILQYSFQQLKNNLQNWHEPHLKNRRHTGRAPKTNSIGFAWLEMVGNCRTKGISEFKKVASGLPKSLYQNMHRKKKRVHKP
jgi:hypothetical protein